MYSLYRNSDLDHQIVDCLLASVAAVKAEDVRPSILFVGDLNGHHQEWLCSNDPSWSGCVPRSVMELHHARGGTLDLVITDIPHLVRVAVVAQIGNSHHSFLSAVISMAQIVKNLCVSRKVFLKYQVNWNTVCGAIWELP